MFYIIKKPENPRPAPKIVWSSHWRDFWGPQDWGFQPRLQNAQFYIRGHIFNQRWIPVIQGPEHPPTPTPTDPIEPPPLHFSAMDEGEKEEKEKEEEEKDRGKKRN